LIFKLHEQTEQKHTDSRREETKRKCRLIRVGLLKDRHSYNSTLYEGRSINKLQNGAIPSVLKIGKIRIMRFVGNLILYIHTTFLDDDVIIVTSSDNRTQSISVLFSAVRHFT